MDKKPIFGLKPRITKAEENLLKTVFANRDDLVLTVRNLFFGFDLTDSEKKTITTTFKGTSLRTLMRKIFIPELQKDIPVGQNYDLWQTQDVKEATEATFPLIVQTKTRLLEMLERSLKRLEDIDSDSVNLEPQQDLSLMIARNAYINYVDEQLERQIVMLANRKEESPEERAERIKKDSSR